MAETRERKSGKWPFLAPTKQSLELHMMWTERPPRAQIAGEGVFHRYSRPATYESRHHWSQESKTLVSHGDCYGVRGEHGGGVQHLAGRRGGREEVEERRWKRASLREEVEERRQRRGGEGGEEVEVERRLTARKATLAAT